MRVSARSPATRPAPSTEGTAGAPASPSQRRPDASRSGPGAVHLDGAVQTRVLDVDHAFHNDTGPRYNATQAEAARVAAIGWLRQHPE